ncbi:FkbM family methyltransferase [Algoriphagus sp. SE2]|uniref:FkbM family methyltransferase n=1 Tax=Algoriphagus sp. SE2 TaxID=3141536 RepID=UPI0031CD178F
MNFLIKNKIKVFNLLVGIIEKQDKIVLDKTEKQKLTDLISKLQPIRTDKELIRLGADSDGGYLVPNDLKGVEACFSPGVGEFSSFETDCYRHGMKIFMADNSVDSPNLDPKEVKFSFLKKFIGSKTDDQFITLDEWATQSSISDYSDLILQMDIEGFEYESLISISTSLLNRFRIIVVEFHDLDKLWNPEFFRFASIVFEKLLHNHYCVHLHPNNCYPVFKKDGIEIPPIMEFTFLRKDRVEEFSYSNSFPHALDVDNEVGNHVVLPRDWIGNSIDSES